MNLKTNPGIFGHGKRDGKIIDLQNGSYVGSNCFKYITIPKIHRKIVQLNPDCGNIEFGKRQFKERLPGGQL